MDTLDPNFRPKKWGGTFKEVLPYLEEAYDWAIDNFFKAYIDDFDKELRKELETTLRQLCHPDPQKRGHPKNIANVGSSMSVERYISQFNKLATLAEIELSKK